MGKGSGKGSGKGGCEGTCESIHAIACCLCFILIGGPILLGVGGGLLAAANRNDRTKNIRKVDAAVKSWNSDSPNGWKAFQQLSMVAVLKPAVAGNGCPTIEVPMLVSKAQEDVYTDEKARFSSVPQTRFVTASGVVTYVQYTTCKYGVKVLYVPKGSSTNSSLADIPGIQTYSAQSVKYSVDVSKADGPRSCTSRRDSCYGANYHNCQYNCQSFYGGQFSCSNNQYYCSVTSLYGKLCLKVAAGNATADSGLTPYAPDASNPRDGFGCNMPPYGFQRQFLGGGLGVGYGILSGSHDRPTFQLEEVRIPPRADVPAIFSLVVRSSADPYLTYLYVTDGSGYFGISKGQLVATGIVVLLMGLAGTLCWFVAGFYIWRMICAKNRPTARPPGVSGYAWDMANRYGGQYGPAMGVPVYQPYGSSTPTAQPMYASHDAAYPYGYQPYPGARATLRASPLQAFLHTARLTATVPASK